MVELSGNLVNNLGVAINAAAVAVFATSVGADESTGTGSAAATSTTNSSGVWTFSGVAADTYDVRITNGTSILWRRYAEEMQITRLQIGDDGEVLFGNGNDAGFLWSTGDASNHSFVIALDNTSQQLHITDQGAKATDWVRAAGTHPAVIVHSNLTPVTDYLEIGNHDGTTASINLVGGTTLAIQIEGTTEISLTSTLATFSDDMLLNASAILHFGSAGGAGTNRAKLDYNNSTNVLDIQCTDTANNVQSRFTMSGSGLQILTGVLEVGTPETYSASNVTTDRTYDANSTTTAELADILGTLIADLRTIGLVD